MSNLLDKASIILTPTAYDASSTGGEMLSVKPTPVIGSELYTEPGAPSLIESNFSLIQTGWSFSGGVASIDGSQTGSSRIRGSFGSGNLVAGTKYRVRIEGNITSFKPEFSGGGGFVAPVIGSVSGTRDYFIRAIHNHTALNLICSSSGVGSISSVSIKEATDGDFDFTRETIASRYNSNGLIEFVGNNTPRINYLGDTCGYWLLEPQATNTATYSFDFSQGDIFNGSAPPDLGSCILTTASSDNSPDGLPFGNLTNPLLKDNSDGLSGQSKLNYFSTNVSSNDLNVFSIFVKKSLSNDFIYIQTINFDSSANGTSWFNIQNGTLGTIDPNHTAKIEDYGNGWFRCSIAFKTTTDLVGAVVLGLSTANSTINVTRNGTNGVLLWGLQAEANQGQGEKEVPTSFIRTIGATSTRNGDFANNAGDSSLINTVEGVLYTETACLVNGLNNRAISVSSDNENYASIQYNPTSNRILGRYRNAGNFESQIQFDVADRTQFSKIAFRYKQDDFALFVNGVEVGTDTSGNVLPADTFTSLNFSTSSTSNSFEGKTKCVALFKEFLDNDELECLTGSGFDSFTALAQAGGYTII